MTQSNRTRVAVVRETTPGTTPTTPRMRTKRLTGEGLTLYIPEYIDSDEIRSDRMQVDPILVMQASGGTLNDELSFPDDESPDSELYRSAFFSTWTKTPERYNDGTADSVITDAAATGGVFTVTTGAAFAFRHLIRTTGFTNAGNNGIFRITVGSATVPAVGNSQLTNETAPPGTARIKVVGFEGASGDITATSTGLGATSLDFTTLGLAVGQWIKIGGTAAGNKFATAALNVFARVTAIAATALTLDNLPSAWTTDAGTGKTIQVWFGDQIKNGTTQNAMSIEKGFLGQAVPVYLVGVGMTVGQVTHTIANRQKITRQWTFSGMGGSQGTSSLDASPDAQTTGQVMASHANVGRLADGGSQIVADNWARSLAFTINNNLRAVDDLQATSPQAIREGEFTVTGSIETYFGSNALLTKFFAGTASALNARFQKNSQALVFQFPRITYRGNGNPAAGAKNTDAMAAFDWQASYDSTTAAHAILDRLEYYEA